MKSAASPVKKRKPRFVSSEAHQATVAATNFGNMFARLLIALRKHSGLSHREIAVRAGISPATVRMHEAASKAAKFSNDMLICRALGFDQITILHQVDWLLEEAGTPFIPGQKPWSDARFIRERCTPKAGVTPTEVRRQLRIMRQLTLPELPGPPNRKRHSTRRQRPVLRML